METMSAMRSKIIIEKPILSDDAPGASLVFHRTDSRPQTARRPLFGFSSKDSVPSAGGDYTVRAPWVIVGFDEFFNPPKSMKNDTKMLCKSVQKYVFCPVDNSFPRRLFPNLSPQLLHNLLISLWTSPPKYGKRRDLQGDFRGLED